MGTERRASDHHADERAHRVTITHDVEVLARVNGSPVLCRKGPVTVAAFHPELSGDDRIHRRWLADADL